MTWEEVVVGVWSVQEPVVSPEPVHKGEANERIWEIEEDNCWLWFFKNGLLLVASRKGLQFGILVGRIEVTFEPLAISQAAVNFTTGILVQL